MPEIKFNSRWEEHLTYYKETAKRIDGEQIKCIFHIYLGDKTNEIMLRIDEWIRQEKGEYGHVLTPEPTLIDFFHANGEPNSDFFTGTERSHAQFLQDAEISAAFFGQFKPGYSMCVCPGSEMTKENWMNGQSKLRMYSFPERRLEEKVVKHALQRQ